MLKKISINSTTNLKLLSNIVNEDKFDDRYGDKKNLPIFSILQRPIGADYQTFVTKKAFNLLQSAFIQIQVSHHFDIKYHICIKPDVSYYINSKVSN